jgi:hypothetical protein
MRLNMLTRTSCLILLVCIAALPSQAGERNPRVVEPSDALRQALKLDPFYRKCVMLDELAIVGSARVQDPALLEAAYLVDRMLAGRADLRQALVKHKVRVAVMAHDEFTTTIPEHSDLKPPAYWNKRARGLGATRVRPAVSCGAENLLQYTGDPYHGENILIHEFGHAIHEIALREVDLTFDDRLTAAFDQARRDGLWKGTYAATNRSEYWAEGVQSWFDCNRSSDRQHNGIATRAKLKEYDPRLAQLLAEVFRNNDWRYLPPSRRPEPGHLAGYDRSKSPRFVWPPEVLRAFEQWEAGQKGKKPLPAPQ